MVTVAFADIPTIEDADFYIDLAFRQATKAGDLARNSVKGNRLEKSRRVELAKMLAIKRAIEVPMIKLVRDFPSVDDLTEFYKMLLKTQMDYGELKKSCGAMTWVVKQINRLFDQYKTKVQRCELTEVNRYRREFYGRVSSVLKQVKDNLQYLEQARRVLLSFPTIKQKCRTVCIAGFPNVGKTTLLKKMTSSKAEVNSYAFTTKKLNSGYRGDLQFIDTPGTLDRVDTMNPIEQQAYLAMKYCAEVIIYVFDVTEPYPMVDQKALLRRLRRFDVPILVYVSKVDVAEDAVVEFVGGSDYHTQSDTILKAIENIPK